MPPQPMPMATQQQFLAQQNAAYAQQAAAASYMMPGQDGFMTTTMLAPPSYYGVPPWVYPGLIPQQGTQPRRPLTPSQGAENQPFVSILTLKLFFLETFRLFTCKIM